MAKRRNRTNQEQVEQAFSRRDFFKAGAVAGLGAAALSVPGQALAQSSPADITWDYEADIVVCGSGAAGLTACIRAKDLGASVIVLDANYDVGGKFIHSGGWTSLGGGDVIQERDRIGADPDNMGLSAPMVPPEDLEDDPDRLFVDMTDWSIVNTGGNPIYRHNSRELQRGHADASAPTRQLMVDNYVRFTRIYGTHSGGGMTRARAARSIFKLGEVTDIRAGTISPEDLGSGAEERHTPFNPKPNPDHSAASIGAEGWVQGGVFGSRPMEFSAREKGVQFMLNRHMDELIREQPFSGRVVGVRASYTPRINPETGQRLESYWQNGNIDERAETVYIRARRAVIVATGGHQGNPHFRSMFDPRAAEPFMDWGGNILCGPLSEDGSGIIAGMRIGANLAGMMENYFYGCTPKLSSTLATGGPGDALLPGHPAFVFQRAAGVNIGAGGWEHVIAVNQVGQRFYNESAIPASSSSTVEYPPGESGRRFAVGGVARDVAGNIVNEDGFVAAEFTPTDWRNASVETVKAKYARDSAHDAALAMNEGSRAPDYRSGPVWTIFDSAAVNRGGWRLRHPYIADPPDGYFFQADTLAELAQLVTMNQYQTTPLKYLEETVAKYNAAADAGRDDDFEKPVLHRIDTAPFYAAFTPIGIGDGESHGGLRINGKAQVLDMEGEVIPGLYAGGEASGPGIQHGIGRATVHGYMAATDAMKGGA